MDTKKFRILLEKKRVEDITLHSSMNKRIHVYFGLKGRMEIEHKATKITFHNCNGFPSDKHNKHKIK